MTRVRSKICGITRVEDALKAVQYGADALGLVFYDPSPRALTVREARQICEVLPPFVTVVALVVDKPRELILELCRELPVSLLQFHGDEIEADCMGFGVPYIKALRVRSSSDFSQVEQDFPSAAGILVDTYQAGAPGGTGETFDWSMLPRKEKRTKPLILAGGLNSTNVRKAINHVEPFAVDVSGGVESSKGIKDSAKIDLFIKEVCRGNEA
jgi:phosphoribosylanthranilate isomerase